MKELSIEEKAKRYDEVLAKAVKIHRNYKGRVRAVDIVIEEVFPELKESKDEKIRETIVECVKTLSDSPLKNKCIAWLEKQCEQKPADKIEQKGMNIVEEDMTPFQKKVFCIIDTTIEEEHGLKQVCDELLRLAHDDIMQNSAWSEEDEKMKDVIYSCVDSHYDGLAKTSLLIWLKSLKPQNTWKPSDKQLNNLLDVLSFDNCTLKRRELLESLYNDLKKLREE